MSVLVVRSPQRRRLELPWPDDEGPSPPLSLLVRLIGLLQREQGSACWCLVPSGMVEFAEANEMLLDGVGVGAGSFYMGGC